MQPNFRKRFGIEGQELLRAGGGIRFQPHEFTSRHQKYVAKIFHALLRQIEYLDPLFAVRFVEGILQGRAAVITIPLAHVLALM